MPTLPELIAQARAELEASPSVEATPNVEASPASNSNEGDVASLIAEARRELFLKNQPIMTSGRDPLPYELNVIEDQHPSISNVDRYAAKNMDNGSAEAGIFASRVPEGVRIVLDNDGRIVAEDEANSGRFYPIDPDKSKKLLNGTNPLEALWDKLKEGSKEVFLDNPKEVVSGAAGLAAGIYTGGVAAPAATTAAITALGELLPNRILREQYGDFVQQKSFGQDAKSAIVDGGVAGLTEAGVAKGLGYGAKLGLLGGAFRTGKDVIDATPNVIKGQYDKSGAANILKKPIRTVQNYLGSFTTPEGQSLRFLKSNELVNGEAISQLKNKSLNKFGRTSGGTDGIVDNAVNLYKFAVDETGKVVKQAKPTTTGSLGNLITRGGTEEGYEMASKVANSAIDELASYADNINQINVPLGDIVSGDAFKKFLAKFNGGGLTTAVKQGSHNNNLNIIVNDLEQIPQVKEGIKYFLQRNAKKVDSLENPLGVTEANKFAAFLDFAKNPIGKAKEGIEYFLQRNAKKVDSLENPLGVTDADRFAAFLDFAKSPAGKDVRLTAGDLLELKRATDSQVADYANKASNFSEEGLRGLAQVYRESYRGGLDRMVGGERVKDLEELLHNVIPLRGVLNKGAGEATIAKNQITSNIPSPINSFFRATARSIDKASQSEWLRQFGVDFAGKAVTAKNSLSGKLGIASGKAGRMWNALPEASTLQSIGQNTGLATAPFLATDINAEPKKPMPIANSVDALLQDPLAIRDLVALTGDPMAELSISDNINDRDSLQRILLNYKETNPEIFAGGFGIDGVLTPSEMSKYEAHLKREQNNIRTKFNSYDFSDEKKAMASTLEGNLTPQPYLMQKNSAATNRVEVVVPAAPSPTFNEVSKRIGVRSNTITDVVGMNRNLD